MFHSTIYGHPRADRAAVDTALRADFGSAAHLDGEFAVAVKADNVTSLFCSADGVTQLFYAVQNGTMHYGRTVSEVVAAAGLIWEWDYRALADFATWGHLIGRNTLHPAVHRVGRGEFVAWNGYSVARSEACVDQDVLADPIHAAIEALVDSVKLLSRPDDVIAMSAGFDSRLILAAFLSLGLKPNLVVMGHETSTDVVIATEIARAFELHIDRIPLNGDCMMAARSQISRLTSGTKTIDNWHTYEYVAASSRPIGSGIWIGTNGEYARTLYVDRGAPFVVANTLGHPLVTKFWQVKIARNALPVGIRPYLARELVESLQPEPYIARLNAIFTARSLGAVNDDVYLERVHQFQANGLRLVSTKYTPKTPFVHRRWLAAVKQMPRSWKLGNRWHRHAIGQLYPRLLAIRFDETGTPMSRRPGLKYWLGFSAHSRNTPYFDYTAFVRRPVFREAFEKAAGALTGVIRGDDTSVLLGEWPLRMTTHIAALGFYQEMQRNGAVALPAERTAPVEVAPVTAAGSRSLTPGGVHPPGERGARLRIV